LQDVLRKEIGNDQKEIDMNEYISKLALELISQAGFGYTFNSFEDKYNEYAAALKQMP
jgi:hypothetical protein